MEKGRPLNRITGTEMEWGGMVSDASDPDNLHQLHHHELQPSVDQYLDEQRMAKIGTSNNYFLGNGSRLYQDVSDRREYATPEDDSFLGTTANEIVNDGMMADISTTYRYRTGKKLSFTKRMVDDKYIGCGYHVSYSANAEKLAITEEDLALFGVFAATRSVLFGSGALLPGTVYAIAQKALVVDTDFSEGTVRIKPVVNLRNEPLADRERFLRLHDTSGDPTMSPWATRVKFGAASIVLKMIEQGISLGDLRFKQPLFEVSNRIALDTYLEERFPLRNGDAATALDVQEELVAAAREMLDSDSTVLSEEEIWTLDQWDKALADLRQDPRLTVDRIDWVMRLEILNRLHERHGWGWNSNQLRYKDRQFSEVALDGIAVALRETVWADFMPPEHVIKERRYLPPTTTRAHLRGQFIRDISRHPEHIHSSATWDSVAFNGMYYPLSNPYATKNRRLAKLLRGIDQPHPLDQILRPYRPLPNEEAG